MKRWRARILAASVCALLSLSRAGEPRTVDALIERFDDARPEARASVHAELAALGPRALPALLRALEQPAWLVRFEASEALRALGVAAAPAGAALARTALDDADPNVRGAAARALGVIDPGASGVLGAGLASRDPEVRLRAVGALGHMRLPGNVPRLVEVLGDARPDIRGAAVTALWLSSARGVDVVPAILPLLDDEDPAVRVTAIHTLGHLRTGSPPAVDALLGRLRDGDARDRAAAAWALTRLGPAAAPAALPALRAALRDPSRQVRASALGLGHLGPLAAPAVPDLIEALDSDDSSAGELRLAALQSLEFLGPDAAPALPALARAAADDEHEGHRVRAAHAIGRIGGPGAVAALEDALGDGHPWVRGAAAAGLEALAPARRGDVFLLGRATLRAYRLEALGLLALLAAWTRLWSRVPRERPAGRARRAALVALVAAVPALALSGAALHVLTSDWAAFFLPRTVIVALPLPAAAVTSIAFCCALLAVWTCQRRAEA